MTTSPLILVVEDSQTQAQELAATFYNCGMEVLIANDGPQALRMVDACSPDAIILDVNLPSMTGYQVCDRLRRDPKTAKTPIIMLTSADSSPEIQEGYRCGANAYIPKGKFAIDHLLATLERMGIPIANSRV